ncbi:MAP kinase kinase kinase win1 [Tolypocladium capitatum]|uniref:MAP kinase kinase kinase win1 n=1 Tax=Tolypocladium capitatum TaxID=45235 RepID=A0A2K3QNK2_9HYPO|nr:MAP kinase kinase kinase win1 [Tolypocladium capitatum]
MASPWRLLDSLGWAHNDLNPGNILVNEVGMPVLIGFGSSHEVGIRLTTSRGTKGCIDVDMKDYTTSEKRHDISALAKIRVRLNKPTFET